MEKKLTMRQRIEGDKYLVQIIDLNLPMLEAEEVPYEKLKISDLMPNYEDLGLPKEFREFTIMKLRKHLEEHVLKKSASVFCKDKGPRKLFQRFIEALQQASRTNSPSESKNYLTMMTNMLYELGEDVNDIEQRRKFDIEYQKYLEKEGKKRPSKARLTIATPAPEEPPELLSVPPDDSSPSRHSSQSSETLEGQDRRFNNSFCHFESLEQNLGGWESDEEVPEQITHQESVEDLKQQPPSASAFKEEVDKIKTANKTGEGFHRRQQNRLVQQSTLRRGSAGAIRNITFYNQNHKTNEMEFDLLPEARKTDIKFYQQQKSGSAHLTKRPSKNPSPVQRKKSQHNSMSNSPQRSTLSRVSMPSASITDSIQSAPVHYEHRGLIESASPSPVLMNAKAAGQGFSKSNSPPHGAMRMNQPLFRLNVCQTPGQTSRKPFTPSGVDNPRRTPNENARRKSLLAGGAGEKKTTAPMDFKSRLLETDDARRMLSTADVQRFNSEPSELVRPPSTADVRNKNGAKIASFLLKTMLQKRAATTIKEGGSGLREEVPAEEPGNESEEDEEEMNLRESLNLTNYQKSSQRYSGKVPDKLSIAKLKQRKNASVYSEGGTGFLATASTRPLSQGAAASTFRRTPRENPQDCDSMKSLHDHLQDRRQDVEDSPRSQLEAISVFERDSLDGSDEELESPKESSDQSSRQIMSIASRPLLEEAKSNTQRTSPRMMSMDTDSSEEEKEEQELETSELDDQEEEDEEEDEEDEDQDQEEEEEEEDSCEYSESGSEEPESSSTQELEESTDSRFSSRIGSRMEQNLKGGKVFEVIEEEEHSITETPTQPEGHKKTQSIKSFLDKQQAITLLGSGQIVASIEGIGKDNDPYDQLKELSRLTEMHEEERSSSNQNTVKQLDSQDQQLENDFKIDIIKTPPSRDIQRPKRVPPAPPPAPVKRQSQQSISKFVNYNVILSDSDTLARDDSDSFNHRNPLEGGFPIGAGEVQNYLGDELRNINMSDRMSVDISETFEESEAVNTATIRCLSYLGSGGEGRVLLGEITAMKEPIALKQFLVPKRSEKRKNVYETLRQEIHMVKSLNHPNIITYYGLHKSPNPTHPDIIDYNILMEFMPGGNLQQLIQKYPSGLKISRVRTIVRQILEGLYYLHQNNIIHRDLKPENILLNRELTGIKIGDFGISTNMSQLETSMKKRTCAGTPWYMAPEIILSEPYSFGVDIWSLGCCCFELVSGQKPYGHYKGLQAMFQMVQKNTPLEESSPEIQDIFYDKRNRKLLDFLQKCWRFHRQSRPSAKELLEHPFLRTPQKPQQSSKQQPLKKSSSRASGVTKSGGAAAAAAGLKKTGSNKSIKQKKPAALIPLSASRPKKQQRK